MSSSNTAEITPPPPPLEHGSDRPLLPIFLLQPSVLLWLWVLPVGILLLLNLQGYRLIEGNLNEVQRVSAKFIGGANLAILFAGLGCYGRARWLSRARRAHALLHPGWSLAAIVAPAAYLWFAVASVDQTLPRSVTVWLYPEPQFLFNQFAFAMLPLFWGILRVAAFQPTAGFRPSFFISLGFAIGAPLFVYLLLTGARSLRFTAFEPVVVAAVFVLAGIIMFVALARVLLLSLRNAQRMGQTGERLAILVFALLLPLGGLLLNRSIPFPEDFQAWEVYGLVAVNFGILLLASFKHSVWPQGSLCLLGATLPFSLYFFVVFLPYTPLSILAVIVMGAGFLVLTPILLFVLHLHLFNQAWLSLPASLSRRRVTALCTLCFLLLPAFFVGRGLADKIALNAALDYVYTPSLETQRNEYRSSRLNLRRALDNHRAYKNGIFYPLLSPFYSWLVFDNLVLPDDKLAALEKTFFSNAGGNQTSDPFKNRQRWGGDSSVRERNHMPRARPVPRTVELQTLGVAVQPADPASTTLTLTFTLKNTGPTAAEYAHSLPLPPGVYVTGFRLQIDGKSVPGRITEKKTALWVYTMIRDSERRDPGLLFYNGSDHLELRVFPVTREKPSVVEIDFLVPAPIAAMTAIEGITDPDELLLHTGTLGRTTQWPTKRGVALLVNSPLPAVPRETYLHVIVDRSDQSGFTGGLADTLTALHQRFPEAKRARVTLANYDVVTAIASLTPLDGLKPLDAATIDHLLPRSGGFSLDRAVADAIRLHRADDLDQVAATASVPPRPIFVILSNRPDLPAEQFEFAGEWSDLLPQLEVHQFTPQGIILLYRGPGAAATALVRIGGAIRPVTCPQLLDFPPATGLGRPECFDPATGQWRPLDATTTPTAGGPWSEAAELQLAQRDYLRSPGDSVPTLKALVAASRERGVLIPATSYIVVENQAQWRMLALSERRKLEQNSALSFRETPAPPALWVALGFGGWLLLRRLRLRRSAAALAWPPGL